jgi:hypothetical protein
MNGNMYCTCMYVCTYIHTYTSYVLYITLYAGTISIPLDRPISIVTVRTSYVEQVINMTPYIGNTRNSCSVP